MSAKTNPLGLTDRQVEVMRAVCRNGGAKQAVDELGVANRMAVDCVIRNAAKRIGARTRLLAILEFDRADRARQPTGPASVFELGGPK